MPNVDNEERSSKHQRFAYPARVDTKRTTYTTQQSRNNANEILT